MTLTTRTAATLVAAIALFAVAPASAGIDRGIGVEPSVLPAPDAVDRYLVNQDNRPVTAGLDAVDRFHAGEVKLVSQTDAIERVRQAVRSPLAAVATSGEPLWSTQLVAASIAASFALGVLGTALVTRRRTLLTP